MAKSSVERVKDAAKAAGLGIEILHMPESTRTAEEAARACSCSVAQIVKSLIFQREDTQSLVLALIAGDRQADLRQLADWAGGPLKRADPKFVRAQTGFAIGGVAPLGHLAPVPTAMDPSLLQHNQIWAAAGAPNAVFCVEPVALRDAAGAYVLAK